MVNKFASITLIFIVWSTICNYNEGFLTRNRRPSPRLFYLLSSSLSDDVPESVSIRENVQEHQHQSRTRLALVNIIENSWERVVQLMPQVTLELCEDELKGATALLVLATVRRAADDSLVSRATVEQMFRDADVNGDGQVQSNPNATLMYSLNVPLPYPNTTIILT